MRIFLERIRHIFRVILSVETKLFRNIKFAWELMPVVNALYFFPDAQSCKDFHQDIIRANLIRYKQGIKRINKNK